MSVTFLERERYHCDHGRTVGGDAKRNTSFRVEFGLEEDFFPEPGYSTAADNLSRERVNFT